MAPHVLSLLLSRPQDLPVPVPIYVPVPREALRPDPIEVCGSPRCGLSLGQPGQRGKQPGQQHWTLLSVLPTTCSHRCFQQQRRRRRRRVERREAHHPSPHPSPLPPPSSPDGAGPEEEEAAGAGAAARDEHRAHCHHHCHCYCYCCCLCCFLCCCCAVALGRAKRASPARREGRSPEGRGGGQGGAAE
jgi:hypothetical protein